MKVGDEGKISAFNFTGRVNVIVDVVGYYTESTGAGFTSVSPNRILDSRNGTGGFSSPWAAGTERSLKVTGGDVPADAEAVVLNVTATDTNAVSFLSIWPNGQAKPEVSSLNWSPGWTIPNAVTVKVGTGGNVKLFNNQGTVNVIADVVGYLLIGVGIAVALVAGRGLSSMLRRGRVSLTEPSPGVMPSLDGVLLAAAILHPLASFIF